MKIAYGIHGYGQGHATRAWAVLQDLQRRHDVRIFAGGNAYQTLRGTFDICEIPSFGFVYRGTRSSKWRTLVHNLPYALDVLMGGAVTRRVITELRSFVPDVVICDCEPWTFRAAGFLSIPRIAFDHFGIMVRCKVPMPLWERLRGSVDRMIYRLLVGRAERALVSSFYRAAPRSDDVRVVGPLLRAQARAITPVRSSYVLAYFNKGADQLKQSVFEALCGAGVDIRLYGADRTGRLGNLYFQPRSDEAFLRDLAGCRAVISTAGNQLVGEAMMYGKPFLAIPEASVEQHMNASAISALGIGEWSEPTQLTSERIRAFLEREHEYAQNAKSMALDGREEAVETLERWCDELRRQRALKNRFRESVA